MEYGHLERVEREGKPIVYYGEINMPNVSGEICLVPRREKRSEDSPDFEIKVKSPGRDWFPMGAAWAKKHKDGRGIFFTLTLDHPGMAQPIYCAAFADDEDKQPKDADFPVNYTIIWGRAPKAAGGGSDPVLDGDNIPY